MAFWSCPNCGRKVPGYSAVCHCGTSRTQASSLPSAPTPGSGPPGQFSAREVPWPVWALLGVVVLAVALGVFMLFRPPEPIVPLPLIGAGVPPRPSPEAQPSPAAEPTPAASGEPLAEPGLKPTRPSRWSVRPATAPSLPE